MQPVLAVRDISKRFGAIRAVDGVSFAVRPGTITGLLGRNGAGKTTCLRMITGVFLPDSGSIETFGSSNGGDTARDRIGYLPEERGLYRKMKVLEHLLFLAEVKRPLTSEVRERARRWLTRLDLWEKRDARVEELSKGNQQKVQLIGALLHDPELVILDEPTSGLDPVNVVLVRRIFNELKAEGRTILLSTHMMAEAEKTVDEIVLIHEGRVVLSGELAKVRSSFGKNNVLLEFSGDGSFLAALPEVEGSSLQTNRAELKLRAGADPQAVLSAAVPSLRVSRFEIVEPSLEEIFIERVGSAAPTAAVGTAS
ncbi:MAG TPA: ATP-binding cassette domain-containing protein [Thermoanaerobaculia bacterium]|nr:ATP-binding cassette domain-containing protein [Thermoanaerobaculia bacterium]